MIKTSHLARLGAVALAVSVFGGGLTPAPAEAQVFERAIQGAIGGAVIGGVTHGGHGIGTGAAIGAAAGAVVGAVEQDQRRRYHKRRHRRGHGHTHRVSRHDPLVYDTQSALLRLGYEPGSADGVYGERTSQAIAEYQRENDLLVTGTPSDALLAHMSKTGGGDHATSGQVTNDQVSNDQVTND